MNRKFTWELDIDLNDGIIADGEWSAVTGIDIHAPGMGRPAGAPDDDGVTVFRALHTDRGTVYTRHATVEEITAHAALAAV